MDVIARADILRRFDQMPDPRGPNAIHNLADMAVMAILAVICGADGWVQVELFAEAKRKWLATFLDLSEGIPSHDTFGRVFSLLDPDAFERCFSAWTEDLVNSCRGKLVAIDGKAIRRSFTRSWDKSGMAHLVSAFVRENQTVFGQVAVADKSNEIEAIPRLLALLDIKGAVVSIDAMGTQRTIAEQIVKADADYVLALKDNQPTLCALAEQLMKEAELDRVKSRQPTSDGSDGRVRYGFAETVDGDHGRIETRRVLVSDEVEALGEAAREWPGLAAIIRVESIRDVDGLVSTEQRLYLTSLKGTDAAKLGDLVRGHWSVENQLHWQLDVSFNEDQRRIRKGHGAENYSRLCRMALNLLKRDKKQKVGIQSKRLNAGWDHNYLLSLISG
jgi:predicted transposase YbfD/YdcC